MSSTPSSSPGAAAGAGDGVVSAQIDPTESTFIFICGKKGYGKSHLAREFWLSYPFDRLVIDPTGDFDAGPDAQTLTNPLPTRWPGGLDDRPKTLRYVPDLVGDPAYKDNMDRAVSLAFYRGRCLVLVDECHELTQAGKAGPHMRRALRQGRHRDLSLVMCDPRTKEVDTLCLSNADLIFAFRIAHPLDRERLAQVIGVDPRGLDELAHLPKYEYVKYDARADEANELMRFPPLPPRRSPDAHQPAGLDREPGIY